MNFFLQIVFAQGNLPITPPPESINCGPGINLPSVLVTTSTPSGIWQVCFLYYLTRIISLLYVAALFLGVIFLAWAGILYITGRSKEGIEKTHAKLKYGLIGLIVALLSLTIVKVIELFFLRL